MGDDAINQHEPAAVADYASRRPARKDRWADRTARRSAACSLRFALYGLTILVLDLWMGWYRLDCHSELMGVAIATCVIAICFAPHAWHYAETRETRELAAWGFGSAILTIIACVLMPDLSH